MSAVGPRRQHICKSSSDISNGQVRLRTTELSQWKASNCGQQNTAGLSSLPNFGQGATLIWAATKDTCCSYTF